MLGSVYISNILTNKLEKNNITPAKRFNNTQKKKMKRLCLIYSIIITLIYLISYIYSITYICNSICICINMILITIIFAKLTKPLQADKEALL